jgi:3-deoxy-D-manno-octulosonic-acid transferase
MYTISACFVYLLACVAYPFNRKIREWLQGQHGNLGKIKARRQTDKNAPLVWMHCASLGEFEQGKPLLETFLKQNPEYKSLVTFFSPSGYLPSRNYKADIIAYIPYDTCFNAKKFLDIVNPSIVFWVKYDYWKNHLKEIQKRKIPCYLVSANFRPNQYFFKPVLKWLSPLHYFTHLFVQTEQSRQLLAATGITNVTVTGDTRFDRVCKIASQKLSFPIIDRFVRSSQVLIVGSSWQKDEQIIAEVMRQMPGIKLIIAPHEINPDRITSLEQTFSFRKILRYSRADTGKPEEANVLIIDIMGILSTIYRYADAAYIGCGFDHGIHNTLEAAVYGIPVTFGPKHDKFEEAKDLIALGGATPINDADELKSLLNIWFNDNSERQKQGKICANYVEKKSGTTSKILEELRGNL